MNTANRYRAITNYAGKWAVEGPGHIGLGYYAGYLAPGYQLSTQADAEAAALIAAQAYAAGRQSVQRELRDILGIQ